MGCEVTDHACRHCFGRLLKDGDLVRCAECGAHVHGDVEELCWCGVSVGEHGKVFECVKNTEKSPMNPQEVVVRERPNLTVKQFGSGRRSVSCSESQIMGVG